MHAKWLNDVVRMTLEKVGSFSDDSIFGVILHKDAELI